MSFATLHLLRTAAELYSRERAVSSAQEIRHKIEEIKYLAAQKKVPRLSLRKEILHLEQQLQNMMNAKQKVAMGKERENAKIVSLKKQMAQMRRRLAMCEEKDVQKKLEKLSHILGDYAAKKQVERELKPEREVKQSNAEAHKRLLQSRLRILKQEIEMQKKQGKDGKLAAIEQQVRVLEGKMGPAEIQHQVLFEPVMLKANVPEISLPLPPPPKMKKMMYR
ncbi:hypothetical protein HYX14_05830 [Candidatus Woesearchaeota archaeon]|nr:hypothetical protein [Candidatus Woesearchaeota archaeon]